MGWRFQKRVRVLPGVTLNFSRKGVSTSIGTRGARVTYGHGKKRTTVGIPGTGISHTSVTSTKRQARSPRSDQPRSSQGGPMLLWLVGALLLLWVVLPFFG
jgi:hypothetical protein